MIESLLSLLQPSGPCARLRRVLDGGPHPATALDLAVLARQALRHADLTAGVEPQWRAVERSGRDVLEDACARVGLEILPGAGGSVSLRALAWAPDWLDGRDPFAAAVAALPRRAQRLVPGDPFLGLLGYENKTYNTESQREAVRAALTAPPGSTLLVNLPTGMGKSLCAQALGVVPTGDERRLTLVVVPTDALNLDQEARLRRVLRHRVAYRGADSDAEKREFARRIYANQQEILFAAPEAICRRLRGPLSFAASRGWLRAVVIDEAHLMDAWGDAFRPEFQELPGLRRLWLHQAAEAGKPGFVTVLLSATVTPDCAKLLRGLFPPKPPSTWAAVRDPQARPEPEYWFADCVDLALQTERLLEAARHAPRPLLVYTTLKNPRRADELPAAFARHCRDALVTAGFGRVELFDGNTKDDDRRRIVGEWGRDELDIVVATSAFGLGVDKADVRSVVHCCVPEGVDRYYQEVGRGGRDGAACGSLVLYTATDLQVARGMASQKIITSEPPHFKGWSRWHKMAIHSESGATEIDPGRFRLDAGLIPDYRDPTTEESDHNVAWNVRTLQLMARSGIVELGAEGPPSPPRELTPEELVSWWDVHRDEFDRRIVRIIDQQARDYDHWHEVVNSYRQREEAAGRCEVDRMVELLQGRDCVLRYLADTYNDPNDTFLLGGRFGGCPACRRSGAPRAVAASDWRRDTWPADGTIRENLDRVRGERSVLFLTYPVAERDAPERLARWLVENGVVTVLADEPGGWGAPLLRAVERLDLKRLVFLNRGITAPDEDTHPARAAWQPRPTALAFPPGGGSFARHWRWLRLLLDTPPDYPLFLVIPDDLPDPDRRDRRMAEVVRTADYASLRRRYGLR
jgi:superfamily II DNA/RNA helicase